jgi:hypothetical protein
MPVDASMRVLAVDSGNLVVRIVLDDREAEKAFIEGVGAAERLAVVARGRVWLPSVESIRLCRVRRGTQERYQGGLYLFS